MTTDHDAVVDEMLVSIGKQADRANKAEAALAERDERIAELTEIALARADALAERDRRIAELERALRAISDEAREGYYDGPGLQRFVEIRGLAEDALAPVGGASDDMAAHNEGNKS